MTRKDKQGLLFLLYIPTVILAKLIRYTILKESTVDQGGGHTMIKSICEGNLNFVFAIANTEDLSEGSPAAHNAMWIFQKFNWFQFTTYEGFEVGISIVFNLITLYLFSDFCRRNKGLDTWQLLFLLYFVGVLNVYTFVLSKEPVQMLYFFLMYFALRYWCGYWKKWILCLGVIALIVLSMRTYYVLMAMFAIGFVILYPRINNFFKGRFYVTFVFFLLTFGAIYYLFLNVCEVLRPNEYEELIRVRTREGDAVTQILTVVPVYTKEGFALNYAITVFRLLFPIELFRLGVKYGVFVLFQMLVSFIMFRSLKIYDRLPKTKQIAVCLYWGFLFCSASFEPDFGSWVRHESVTLPFLLFVLQTDETLRSYDNYKSKKKQSYAVK